MYIEKSFRQHRFTNLLEIFISTYCRNSENVCIREYKYLQDSSFQKLQMNGLTRIVITLSGDVWAYLKMSGRNTKFCCARGSHLLRIPSSLSELKNDWVYIIFSAGHTIYTTSKSSAEGTRPQTHWQYFPAVRQPNSSSHTATLPWSRASPKQDLD